MLSEKYVSVVNAILRVIPDDKINRAISRGQRDTREAWEWGDDSLLWIEIAMSSGIACTKEHVYSAHSQMSGIPKRTLRHYADHAKFFEKATREQYEPLAFSHFMVAKRFGPRWKGVLGAAADYLEKVGRLPSAEWLEWKFSKNAQPVLEADAELEKVTDEMVESMKAEDESKYDEIDIEVDPAVATEAQARRSFDRMHVTVGLMAKLLPWLPISVDRQVSLSDTMYKLLNELEEAMQEVAHTVPKGE